MSIKTDERFVKTIIMKRLFILFALTIAASFIYAQEEVLVKHSCNLYHEISNKTFTVYKASPEADQIVVDILKAIDLERNFVLKSADCERVLATAEGRKRIILYNPEFIKSIDVDPKKKWIVYTAFAHAIGHHVNGHEFEADESKRRYNMELEADKFAGGVLYILGATMDETKYSLQQLIRIAETETHPYVMNRSHAIEAGWIRSYDVKMRELAASNLDQTNSNSSGGNGGGKNSDPIVDSKKLKTENDDDASMINFLESKFPYPPPDCNSEFMIPGEAFSECKNLGEVAQKITSALNAEKYPYRYLSFPNGYVIVTQMEQYNDDGTIIEDSETRWVDYPKQEAFSWSIDYFSSLIFPNKGYLRVFVFIVTSENYGYEGQASKSEASSWHNQGVNKLPHQIEELPYSDEIYDINLLTYEFEVPESNHKAKQKCPCCKFQARDHLEKSRLIDHFFK